MIKHSIITRLRYDDDQKLTDRLEVCKEFCIPSMLEQECQDFEIHIIANERHWTQILFAFAQFQDERINFCASVDACRYALTTGNYQIQTRHDSDDVMVPAYTWKIRDIYEQKIRKWKKFLINFQPIKLVAETGEQFYHHRKYSTDCISMFPTFCQRDVKETILSGERSRLSQRLTKNVVNVPEGYVKSLIHKGNMTSHLRKSDRGYP